MKLRSWWAIAMACTLSACGGGGRSDASSAAVAHVVLTATGPSGRVANGSTVVLDVVVTNTDDDTAGNEPSRSEPKTIDHSSSPSMRSESEKKVS